MSVTMQAAVTNEKASSSPEMSFFKLRAQLLKQGRTDTLISASDNLQLRLKVYASGGENGLHAHAAEDHSFLVLQGRARFYDKDDSHRDVGRYEGIMIPAGAYYRFEAISEEELILYRVAAKTGKPVGPLRMNPKGGDMPAGHVENKKVETIFKEEEFFE